MDKRQLVELTIERLLANFERSPESFDLKLASSGTYGGPSVTWKPRVQLGSYDSTIVDDPNNNHAIIVTFDNHLDQLSCHLFMKCPVYLDTAKPDQVVASACSFVKWRSHYRKFMKLCELIKARDIHRENMNYLSKLTSVFPDTLDKHILKD